MMDNGYAVRIKPGQSSLWKDGGPLLGKLDMELTERCNCNCIHCYINLSANDDQAKKKELATDEIKDILVEAASLGCLTVRFTGGEPLLRDDFEELYIFVRRLGIKVQLFTNGTLITKEIAALFSHMPPLEKIEVSVYGMKRQSYEAVTRTPGSFDRAMRGMDLLMANNVPFIVKGTVLPQNKGEIESFEKWALEIPWMDYPLSFSQFYHLRGRRTPVKNNDLIKKLRPTPVQGVRFLSRGREEYVKEMSTFCKTYTSPPGDRLFTCGAGKTGCMDAYGNFQLCMLLRHPFTVYNLKEGSMKQALTEFFPEIRQMKSENPDYLKRCAKCFLKGLCEQCPAKSWSEHGTLDTPTEYYCDIAHEQARDLGILSNGENAWEVKKWKERVASL